MAQEYRDFDVYDKEGNFIGEIQFETLHDDPVPEEMPKELEICGVIYKPQF